MGNTRSAIPQEDQVDIWWQNSDLNSHHQNSDNQNTKTPEINVDEERTTRQERAKKDLDEFKIDLARKHDKHRKIIVDKRKEMQDLRDLVEKLQSENEELKRHGLTSGEPPTDETKQKNLELKITIAELQKELQDLNAEVVSFETERNDYKAHVVALKDVITVSKEMLAMRESQLKELRDKIQEIEDTFVGKELTIISNDLRKEYEKQLQNIRHLRQFYDERQRADRREKDEMKRLLEGTKKELEDEGAKNSEFKETVERLEEDNSKKYDEIKNLESTLGLSKAECCQYQSELSVINQLFSQILLGFNNSQDIDIDKLIIVLEENHHILQDIAINEDSSQVSALPKVLLDLVAEVSDKENSRDEQEEDKTTTKLSNKLNSASEIVENLPKVWKVLIELLSHQSAPISNEIEKNKNPCYKVVETPKGPHQVLSVSQTYIRLRNLIREKKSISRETGRLKHLNTHLEYRLQEQEKRLDLVSNELTETWHVVGKLQKEHQLLHTQEKILRYELAQKRKLLAGLREELENSREKWQEARERNSTTAKQWEELRSEFASRKIQASEDNNTESGYSGDDKEGSSEEDLIEKEKGYESDVSECNNTENPIVEVIQQEIEAIAAMDEVVPDAADVNQSVNTGEKVTEVALELEDVPSESSSVEEVNINELIETPKIDVSSQDSEATALTVEETRRLVEDQVEERVESNHFSFSDEDIIKFQGDLMEPLNVASGSSTTEETKANPTSDASREFSSQVEDTVLTPREERLLRLESQCSNLLKQMTNTSSRGTAISEKLDSLHEIYGEGSRSEEEQGASGSVQDAILEKEEINEEETVEEVNK